MSATKKSNTGFTLIELLVVISIIAILSSIVLAALSSARNNAKYASVQESLIQMRTTYELQYTNVASYTTLVPSLMSAPVQGTNDIEANYTCNTSGAGTTYNNFCLVNNSIGCTTLYTGSTQATQAASICTDIMNKLGSSGKFYFGVINSVADNSDYAFAVVNPGNPNSLFCIRSGGGNVVTTSGYQTCLTKSNW